MRQVRFKRPRRLDLTPFRAVLIYGLVFLLVCWHQSGRVAEWFENQALEREGRLSETALTLARLLRENVFPYGPAQLHSLEDALLGWLTPQAEVGAIRPPAPRPDSPAEEELKEDADQPPELAAQPQEQLPWPDPAADPSAWLSQVNPDEYLPGTARVVPVSPAAPDESPPESAPTPTQPEPARPEPARPEPAQPEPARPLPPPPPRFSKLLLLGDSMMLEGFGPQLQKELRRRHENLTVERDGRYGTGLTRLDYFDWLDFFERMLAKYTPDLVILTVGANDPQDILDPEGTSGRRRILMGTDDWQELYAIRVARLLKLAEDQGAQVFWVGLPIMGREPYGSRVAGINALVTNVCAEAVNCRFWDSWLSVADTQGRFTSYAVDENGRRLRLRGRDFIHLTEEGGRIMAQKFLAETETWADYQGEPTGPPAAPSKKGGEDELLNPPSLEPQPPPSAGDGSASEFSSGSPSASGAAAWSEGLFYSPALGRETVFRLAEPRPGPGPFPVILLLHGAWDSAAAWERELGREALLALAARLKVILALPEGGSFGWYLDGLETAMETFILADFLPEIFKNPAADPGRLAVAGLSMGGHGALTLALKRPDLFQAAGALSAVTDLAAHAGGAHKADSELGLDRVLGPAGPEGRNWRPFGAKGLWESRSEAWKGGALFLGVGLADGLTLAENRAFTRQLTRLGINHVYQEKPGGHEWGYWSAELPGLLGFLAEALGRR